MTDYLIFFNFVLELSFEKSIDGAICYFEEIVFKVNIERFHVNDIFSMIILDGGYVGVG